MVIRFHEHQELHSGIEFTLDENPCQFDYVPVLVFVYSGNHTLKLVYFSSPENIN